jgi:hypothetical protein
MEGFVHWEITISTVSSWLVGSSIWNMGRSSNIHMMPWVWHVGQAGFGEVFEDNNDWGLQKFSAAIACIDNCHIHPEHTKCDKALQCFRNHEAGMSFVRTATSLGMSIVKWVVKCWVMRTHQWYQSCLITQGRFQLSLASASSEMYTYFPVPIFLTKLCLCILALIALTRLFLYSFWIIFFSQFRHLGLLNCWCTLFLDCCDVARIVA